MEKSYKCLIFKINLLILLFGLFVVTCLGQNERTLECKEDDYNCRVNNYVRLVFSKCKPEEGFGYDCLIAQQTVIVESNPNDIAAYLYRGRTYLTKEPDKAILDYKKAVELDAKNWEASIMLAHAYEKNKQYDQAIIVLNKIIELNPNDIGAYHNRGFVYSQKYEFEKAIADYNKVIELKPKGESGYSGRAMVYISQRDFDKAIADLSKAIELEPRVWYNYQSRGVLYKKQGNKAKADADFQKVKELKERRSRKNRENNTTFYFSKPNQI